MNVLLVHMSFKKAYLFRAGGEGSTPSASPPPPPTDPPRRFPGDVVNRGPPPQPPPASQKPVGTMATVSIFQTFFFSPSWTYSISPVRFCQI